MKVSEVDVVNVQPVQLKKMEMPSDIEEKKVEEVAAVETPKPTPTKATPTKTEAPKTVKNNNASKTIRVNIERLDILMNLFEELVIDRGRLQSISMELNHNELNDTVERMTRVSGDLQNIILNMRMVPVETVFNRFPKMVRQLSRDLKRKSI